jgi:rhodanese-related sulfurtransferase
MRVLLTFFAIIISLAILGIAIYIGYAFALYQNDEKNTAKTAVSALSADPRDLIFLTPDQPFKTVDYFVSADKKVETLNAEQLKNLMDSGENFLLLDTRNAQEAKENGKISYANQILIPRGVLEFRAEQLLPNKDQPIVVYCTGNLRSPLAAATLKEMGYTNVRNFEGVNSWRVAGFEVISE